MVIWSVIRLEQYKDHDHRDDTTLLSRSANLKAETVSNWYRRESRDPRWVQKGWLSSSVFHLTHFRPLNRFLNLQMDDMQTNESQPRLEFPLL